MAPPPTPVPGLPYHQVLRLGRPGRWRAVVGVCLVMATVFVFAPLALQVPYAVWLAATGQDVLAGLERLIDFSDPTPLGLAYVNVVLASAIPVTFGVLYLFHGLRPGWLSSVGPRLRWGFLLTCFALAFVAMGAMLFVAALLPVAPTGADVTVEVQPFTRETAQFVAVVLLLTPLQAAGEEYAFRGYLVQACGSLFASRTFAVLASATLFALAHGLGQSWPIFFDRFAFGVVAGVLVIVTGGLEAAIAMHVLNNFFAFGFALAFTDMASALNPTGGSWWSIPVTLTQSLVYLGLAWLVAWGMRVRTTTPVPHAPPGGVLEPQQPRV